MGNITTASVKPLSNRVVLKRSEPKTTKGGILLPDSAKEKPKEGMILAVGPGKLDDKGALIPMQVRVGDRVLFSSYGGVELKTEEEDLLVLSEDDILAVLVAR